MLPAARGGLAAWRVTRRRLPAATCLGALNATPQSVARQCHPRVSFPIVSTSTLIPSLYPQCLQLQPIMDSRCHRGFRRLLFPVYWNAIPREASVWKIDRLLLRCSTPQTKKACFSDHLISTYRHLPLNPDFHGRFSFLTMREANLSMTPHLPSR